MSTVQPVFPDEKATVAEYRQWQKTGKYPPRLRPIRVPKMRPRVVTRERVLDMMARTERGK